jgi:hypothetical protein
MTLIRAAARLSLRTLSFWVMPLPLVLLLVLLVSCGGGGDGDGAGGDSATRERLQKMVLQAEDVPAGYLAKDASFSTNQDISKLVPDPGAQLAKLEAQGRVLGYQLVYEPSSPDANAKVIGIENNVSLYRTAQGAAASFAEAAAEGKATDWRITHPGLEEFEVHEIQRPSLADEVLWLRISGFQDKERSALAIDDLVLLRRGEVRTFMRVIAFVKGGADREINLKQVEGWAARQVQLIDGALKEGQKPAP